MANLDTDLFTQQSNKNITLHYGPSMRKLHQPLRIAEFEYTIPASPGLTSGDKLRLGYLNVPNAKVVPELCRITSQGAGAAVLATLQKVDAAGTATSLTAQATLNENSVALARPSGLVVPEVEEDDYLQLLLGTVTTETEGTVIRVQIAYYSEESA